MNSPQPPKRARKFLEWFCREDLAEAILGDLEELYYRRLDRLGKTKADWLFVWNVLLFFRPFAFKRIGPTTTFNYTAMFKHYFKISWRSLNRQRMYSAIKIGGFSVGIALCLLIALFVQDELNVDQQHENGENMYRILGQNNKPNDTWSRGSCFPAPFTGVLLEHYPEVEKTGRLISFDGWYDAGSNLFRPADDPTNVYEERFAYADQSFIEMFNIPMRYGKLTDALAKPQSILISKRKADKYFPNENPVGKTVILNDDEEKPFVIGGVMENLQHTHLEGFDFFMTLSGVEFWQGEQENWCCWNYSPYVILKEGTDPAVFEEKLLHIRDEYIIGWQKKHDTQRIKETETYFGFDVQPVKDIYLKSQDVSDFLAVSDIRIVWLFATIGVFILLLACINFINLSTAKSSNRAREVGLRKVVGSYRSNLIHQFLSESVFFCAVSVLMGVALANLALPFFNDLADKQLAIPFFEWWFVPSLIGLTLVIGLVSGLYPSFYLSSFMPITVLRGNVSRGSKSSGLRSGLVVFQFTTSIVLIVGAVIVSQQMDFILNKKLGFNKEQVIMIQGTGTLQEKIPEFKEELLRLPEVEYVAASNSLPILGTQRNGNSWWKEGYKELESGVGGQIWWVDPDYFDALGMNILDGRTFSLEMASDSAAVIINQKMADKLGLDNPVGERIENWGKWTIIGVVEDFHFDVMQSEISPLAMVLGTWGSIVSVKVNTQDMEQTLASITGVWDEFKPSQPFRYSFLDESYAHMYDDVKRTGNIFSIFAALAILVACLGLFALSAFMVEQRGKEISIRKVLGASFGSIFNLLVYDFVKLIMIAFVLSVPVSWYLMDWWLEDYAYRIEISWTVFVIAGFMALVIALLTISAESIKAAVANPMKNLRSE